jgi:hypothetical protein
MGEGFWAGKRIMPPRGIIELDTRDFELELCKEDLELI